MKKKLLAGILSLAMVFTLMPSTMVSAGEANTSQTETQAENVQTSNSEAIEAVQSRINALPTVDEFIALADGTTVEDSTLNQAQLDVYNEAQAIAEEIDKLTDEEQTQLDTEKLEALFEYFNGMTAETATTITPSLVGSNSYYISSGGTYTVSGGTYSTSYSSLIIDTTDEVILNIAGNITASATKKAFIYVQKACSNLIINGNGYTINAKNTNVIVSKAGANITIKGGIYTATTNTGAPVISNTGGGTLSIYDAIVKVTGTSDAGQAISNSNSTLNIYSGTIDNGPQAKYTCVAGGTVNMYGGTITAQAKGSAAISAVTVNFTGGTIQNSKYGIAMGSSSSSVKIGGSATFTNNTADIYLASGKQFTIVDDFAGTASVGVADTISDNTKRQITTAGTSADMLSKISSSNSSYTVNYDTSGKYLYLWKHAHTWDYSVSENKITAKCTSDSDCKYYSEELTATLTAPDMTYTGSAYDKASVENNISSVTGATAGKITYVGRGETIYTESTTAPTDAGTYTAKVTITDSSKSATAIADFTINKVEVTKPSADDTKFVYNGSSQTYNVAASDKYTVTGNTRTDAGTQTVTVALNDKTNYKWSDGSTDDLTFTFTIAKADLNLSLALKNWIYGRTPSKPELGNYKGDGTISYFYKKQGEADTEYKSITEVDFNTIVVGKYTLKASVAEGTNYNAATAECDFAVTKQPITVSVSMDGWTYGEEAKSPSVTVKAEDSDITSSYEKSQITYTYYTDSECKNEVVPKNAGTYYVKAEVEATDNYSDGSAVAEFTIAKKIIGIKWSGDNFTYNGTAQAPTATATGLVKGDTCTITVSGAETNANVGEGKYTATATGVDNSNYVLPTEGTKHEFTIAPAEVTVTWTNTELTYNGTEQKPTAKINGAVTGQDVAYAITGGQINAGNDYTATLELNDNNYKLTGEATTSYKILPKELTDAMVSLDHDKFEYNENEQGPSISVNDGVATLAKDTDYEVSGDTSKTALGEYSITITGKGNYTGTVEKIWKICKKLIPDASITKNNYSGTYDGQPHSATVSVSDLADATITYSKSGDGTYTADAPEYTRVGTYTVYYRIEKEGYEDTTGTLTVTINAGATHNIVVTAGEHGSASSPAATAGYGSEVTLTATPDKGYRFKEWKVVSGGSITITNNRFVMPDEDVEFQAVFELIPSSSGGSGNTPSKPGTKEDYTIPVKNEDTVQVDATITDGKAEVSDITKDTLDSVMNNPNKESKVDTITIDLSGAKQTVTSVSLSKTSIKTLSDAVSDKSNGIDSATIELTNATVTLDAKTLQTLDEQAKGSQIELVVEDTKHEDLNASQKKALEEHQVATTFEAYFVSDGERIHDFNGGSAVVAIKFAPEAGRDVNFYHMVYVAENGKLTYYKTRYKNGKIEFTTTHFSDYAIIYDESEKNDTDTDNSGKDETIKVDSSYAALRLRVTKSTKTSNVLKWTKYTGADGYVVYGNFCNTKTKTYKLVKLATVSGDKTTYTCKNLVKGTYYKYYVKAYKLVDGRKVWLATSKVVHATTSGSKYGNAKGVSVNKTSFTLAAGKSAAIKAKQIEEKYPIKYHTDIKYESSDKSVASVSKTGVIKAKKKGTAYIYVYAQNGIYKRVKVTVK